MALYYKLLKRHEKQPFGNNVEIVDSFRKEKWSEKIVKKLRWENLKYIVSLNRCGLNKQVIFYGSFAAIFFYCVFLCKSFLPWHVANLFVNNLIKYY